MVIRFKYVPLFDKEDMIDQRWQINLKGFKAAMVSTEESISIELETAHALLWEHQWHFKELYFKGVPPAVYKLYWELTQLHDALFEDYLELDRFLNNQDITFDRLLKAGKGLFAKGPQPLMVKYAELLEQHGVNTNILHMREKEVLALTVMFIAKTYIVAEEFESIRLM